MKSRKRIDNFMEGILRNFTEEETDPISNYVISESVDKWLHSKTVIKSKLLTEDRDDELEAMRIIMKDIPSFNDIVDAFALDEDEEEMAEEIHQILVDLNHNELQPHVAWRKIVSLLKPAGNSIETISVDNTDVEAEYINVGDTYSSTLLYDPEIEMIGFISWGDWLERAEKAYGPDESQDESTYIDWFDPTKYDDAEEATDAVIEMATKKKKLDLSYGPMFPDERTYFPLEEKKADVIEVDKEISATVDQKGYEIEDYAKGIAKKKSGNRQIKIGKLIKDKPRLIKKFNERLQGQKKDVRNLSIVFSSNPRDIATMSTNRGWTSCAALDTGGPAAEQLPNKIKFGGMVVYLIKSGDKNINDPISRIAIRRFLNEKDGSFALLPEKICYGAEVEGFDEQVGEILDKNNAATMKTTMAIVRDAENGYSDTFGGTEILVGSKRLAKLLSRSSEGSAVKLPKHIKKVWNKKTAETIDKDFITRIQNRISNNLPPHTLLKIILHMDQNGVLSKRFPEKMIAFISNFKTDAPEYKDSIEKYVAYLSKHIPNEFKKIINSPMRFNAISSRNMTTTLVDAIKKHVDSDFQMTAGDAQVMISKFLTPFNDTKDKWSNDDNIDRLIADILPLLKYVKETSQTAEDAVFSSIVGPTLRLEPFQTARRKYNEKQLRNLKKLIRVLQPKFGSLSFDEVYAIFLELESDELRKQFIEKENFVKLKIMYKPTYKHLKNYFFDSVKSISKTISNDTSMVEKETEQLVQFSKFLYKIDLEKSSKMLKIVDEVNQLEGKHETKRAFQIFKDYIEKDEFEFDMKSIKKEKPKKSTILGKKDAKGKMLSLGDKIKVIVGKHEGEMGFIVKSQEDVQSVLVNKEAEPKDHKGDYWKRLDNIVKLNEEVKTESFYEEANKAFRILEMF